VWDTKFPAMLRPSFMGSQGESDGGSLVNISGK
jgi:hypothetical protein